MYLMVRNNRPRFIIEDDHGYLATTNEPIRIVKDYLKNKYWELDKELENCSICMEEICCKKCFSLLSCGHYFHMSCIYKCSSCPLCRN